MKVQVPGGLQNLRYQLPTGLATAGSDCGPLAVINAIRFASGGRVGPRHIADVPGWVRYIRRLAGNRADPFYFMADTYQALVHDDLADRFHRNGLHRLRVDYTYAMPWDTVIAHLRRHEGVLLPMDYRIFNNGNGPSGDPYFKGDHVTLLLEADTINGRIRTLDGDSLFDGRRAGIPHGWEEAALLDFKAAAGAWGRVPVGYGKAIVLTVRRAERI